MIELARAVRPDKLLAHASRGMTQAVPAGLAGASQSYIPQVEAGCLGIERRSTLVAIARVLRVSVADMVGQLGDPTDPLKVGAADVVPRHPIALPRFRQAAGDRSRRSGDVLVNLSAAPLASTSAAPLDSAASTTRSAPGGSSKFAATGP